MKRIDWAIVLFLSIFAASLAFTNINWKNEKVTPHYLETYLRSQDILDYPGPARAHISDSHIYSVSGFLYATGAVPTEFNFQHPPLIKYLFGLSSILFGSPFYIQIIFAAVLPALTYVLGKLTFKSSLIAFLGAILLTTDPLYQELTTQTLLDLGQAVFALLYVLTALHLRPEDDQPLAGIKVPTVHGVFLGLFAASKFWTPALVFFICVELFLLVQSKKLNVKRILITTLTAFLVFNLVYMGAYWQIERFNIFFWQAKIVKFMLHHDTATSLGATIILFLTGKTALWKNTWSIIWPISLISSLVNLVTTRKINQEFFIFLFPPIYLISLITQLPFSRYFILVLPFFYIGLANMAARLHANINYVWFRETHYWSNIYRLRNPKRGKP